VTRTPNKGSLDASPHGLMALYCKILLSAGLAVFILHGVIGFLTNFGDKYGPVLIGMDAVLLLLGFMSSEAVVNARLRKGRAPRGWLLVFVGLYLVVLTSETGGLASPFFMLLLVTCVFAALLMSGLGAVLLTATLAASHAAAAWLLPGGILRDGLEGIEGALTGGRSMQLEEVTGIAMHCAFLFLGSYIAHKLSKDYRSQVSALTTHATRDPLTQLPNRRGFMEKMRHEITRAERYAWPIAILMIDLDHFKRVNDEHGHAFGDEVLAAASQILRDTVGPVDHLARVGGEEFCVAAVAADPNHGAELAQRILRRFREHPWGDMKQGVAVTCSIGVAALDTSRASSDPDASLSRLLDEADRALYTVKENGRNNFHIAGSSAPTTLRARPQLKR
jgi:diguanylate cyclase (GGDEF)-like protein